MRILIVENEYYLAQSIMASLSEFGYSCESAKTKEEALLHKNMDVVVLSTNISDQDFMPVVEKFKESIIILMVSYVNNDTVGEPLKMGADDYLVKPIMMEELARKIKHYKDYDRLKKEYASIKNYMQKTMQDSNIEIKNTKLPLMINSVSQEMADYYAIEIAKKNDSELVFIDLSNSSYKRLIKEPKKLEILHLYNFSVLKRSEKRALLERIADKNVIISSLNVSEKFPIKTLELKDGRLSMNSDFLSLENYLKHIIKTYQTSQTDIMLAKKLGISRKSLWEKRKKYGIQKR